MRLRIAGGAANEVQLAAGGLLFSWSLGTETQVVALLPQTASGVLLTFRIPDERVRDRYTVEVLEAADLSNEPVDKQFVAIALN